MNNSSGLYPTKQAAFTLIELMIVIAIIGILASISYPDYRQSVLRAENSLAKVTLVELSVNLERYYTENNTYKEADLNLIYSKSIPVNSDKKTHQVNIKITDDNTAYLITATPIESTQPILTLESSGLRKQDSMIGWEP